MSDNQILYASDSGVSFFKFVGKVRYTDCQGVDAFVNQLFESEVEAIVIDLTDAQYLDSTNLGLIALMATRLIKAKGIKPNVYCPQPDLLELLDSMCLEQVLDIRAQAMEQAIEPVAVLTDSDSKPDDNSQLILKAHQALVSLSETNKKAFQPVVEMLLRDVGADTKLNK